MKTLKVVLIVFALLAAFDFMANAEPRWVMGLKSGAGAGYIGIELEKEFGGGLSVAAATGIVPAGVVTPDSPVVIGATLAGRLYIGTEARSRFFITAVGGLISVDVPSVGGALGATFVGLAGGYELRLAKSFRIYAEAGLGLATVNVLIFSIMLAYPLYGLSLGFMF